MNLRQRIMSGHLLLTGLLVALSLYGIHRQRAASIIRQQAIKSGQDLAFTQLLNRQVDEYFKLCRLVEETHDNDFRVAADRLLEEAKPLYRRLRSSIADPADRKDTKSSTSSAPGPRGAKAQDPRRASSHPPAARLPLQAETALPRLPLLRSRGAVPRRAPTLILPAPA